LDEINEFRMKKGTEKRGTFLNKSGRIVAADTYEFDDLVVKGRVFLLEGRFHLKICRGIDLLGLDLSSWKVTIFQDGGINRGARALGGSLNPQRNAILHCILFSVTFSL
jgi:hypothetical protein